MQIRVLIADDHMLFRTGLRDALQLFSDIEIVGEAATARAAVAAARETRPDVVIMDLRMPGGDGIDAIGEIRRIAAGTQVLVLSAYGDLELFHRAVRSGAAGYVLKDISVKNLASAIRAVHRGETMINPGIARQLLTELAASGQATPPKLSGLSDREMEILINVARGLSDKNLAAKLFLSESTIKSYLRRIYRKLNLRNRVQAAAYALQHDLLPPTDVPAVPASANASMSGHSGTVPQIGAAEAMQSDRTEDLRGPQRVGPRTSSARASSSPMGFRPKSSIGPLGLRKELSVA